MENGKLTGKSDRIEAKIIPWEINVYFWTMADNLSAILFIQL